MVTESERNVTLYYDIANSEGNWMDGDENFLSGDEKKMLLKYADKGRYAFRNYIAEQKNILLEWSFAYQCNAQGEKTGEKYLVFYEARTV